MNLVEQYLKRLQSLKSVSELFVKLNDVKNLSPDEKNRQIIKLAMIAELDAANLYRSMAEMVTDEKLKRVLSDIAREEIVHFGEFEGILESLDDTFEEDEEKGEDEVEEI